MILGLELIKTVEKILNDAENCCSGSNVHEDLILILFLKIVDFYIFSSPAALLCTHHNVLENSM